VGYRQWSNKRKRDLKHKYHLKFLENNIHRYPPPVIYTKEIYKGNHEWGENPKPYYKRFYRGHHKNSDSFYYKKCANRAVRRYKGGMQKGGFYKKCYDYWWFLY